MRNACDSDSRCGLACDASTRDAKSLAMRVERCEPLSPALTRAVLFDQEPPQREQSQNEAMQDFDKLAQQLSKELEEQHLP